MAMLPFLFCKLEILKWRQLVLPPSGASRHLTLAACAIWRRIFVTLLLNVYCGDLKMFTVVIQNGDSFFALHFYQPYNIDSFFCEPPFAILPFMFTCWSYRLAAGRETSCRLRFRMDKMAAIHVNKKTTAQGWKIGYFLVRELNITIPKKTPFFMTTEWLC